MGIKLPNWLENLNNALGISGLLGVPVSGLVAWGVGRIGHMRLFDVVLLVCVLFSTFLWSLIGFIWLSDRAKSNKALTIPTKPEVDCAWGLQVDGIQLNRDPSNPDHEWQFFIILRNSKAWPLRIKSTEISLNIEGRLPTKQIVESGTQVIRGQNILAVNSSLFKKDAIPDLDRLTGELKYKIDYGHPTHGFSRTFQFHLKITAIIRAPQPSAPNIFSPPILPPYFPMINPVTEDTDIPYVLVAINPPS